MRVGPLLLTLFSVLAATPAMAADPAQLSCPRDQLSEAQLAALNTAAEAMVEFSDPRIAVLTAAIGDCARRHSWSATETEMARRYHLSHAYRMGVRPALIAGGLDLAELERAILADEEFLTRLRTATSGSVLESLVERHADLIMRTLGNRGGTLGERLGGYLGAIAMEEASRRNFIAD